MDKLVSVLGCDQYDSDRLFNIIKKHFDLLGGIDSIIPKNSKVLIKPNLLMKRKPETATTTHPAFVEAVARAVLEVTPKVVIADSPASVYTEELLKQVYNTCGYADIDKKIPVVLNYNTEYDVRLYKQAKMCDKFEIIKPALDADIVISVGKIKTHALTNYTGAVKNLFGCIPGRQKTDMHLKFTGRNDFCSMLVDLCETIKPTICFLDGIIGMEGNGPSGGNPKQLNVTMASKNPHALDLAAAWLIGYSINDVPTLKEAAGRGLCPENFSGLEITGEDIASYKPKSYKRPTNIGTGMLDYIPESWRKHIANVFTVRPQIRLNKCVGCGECAAGCPRKTIKIKNKKASINYENCISCFCCHEMCPIKAIDLKGLSFAGKRAK